MKFWGTKPEIILRRIPYHTYLQAPRCYLPLRPPTSHTWKNDDDIEMWVVTHACNTLNKSESIRNEFIKGNVKIGIFGVGLIQGDRVDFDIVIRNEPDLS